MKQITLISDLKIESENLQIDILSNDLEIAIAIKGDTIPKLDLPFRKLISLAGKQPFVTDQKISVVYNQKEIYQSGKSLFSRYNYPFLIKTFFKNLF